LHPVWLRKRICRHYDAALCPCRGRCGSSNTGCTRTLPETLASCQLRGERNGDSWWWKENWQDSWLDKKRQDEPALLSLIDLAIEPQVNSDENQNGKE